MLKDGTLSCGGFFTKKSRLALKKDGALLHGVFSMKKSGAAPALFKESFYPLLSFLILSKFEI